jgi:ketosteroid isomerase-like protein
MKQILLALTIILTFVFCVAAQSKLEQKLMQLQRAEDEAETKKDFAALERLLDDNYIFTAANGAVYTKKQLIDEIKADDSIAGAQTLSYEEVKTFDYGKAAMVNYLLVVKSKDKEGKDQASRYRMSALWIKRKGNWRIASVQATRVRP